MAEPITKPELVRLSPLRSRFALNPGDTTANKLTLTNDTNSPQTVRLLVRQIGVKNEEYDYIFKEIGPYNWLRFTDETLELAPKQQKEIAYSLAIPTTATPGGYDFAILASIDGKSSNTELQVVHQIASLVYLDVNGSTNTKGQLISYDGPWITSKQSYPVLVRIANQGNTHADSRVLVQAKTFWFGWRQTGETQLKGYTLPNTVRKLDSSLKLGPAPGIYKVTAQYSPPQGGNIIRHKTVLYAPIWFLILATVVLGLIAVKIIFRRRNKNQAQKQPCND